MVKPKPFSIVLYAPEIPGNTGSIGRTCLALNIPLILIRPYGFDLSEKAVRRAGLDYWKHVEIEEFENFDDFLNHKKPAVDQLLFFENARSKSIYEAPYRDGCYLIFGSETKGISLNIQQKYPDQFYELPMFSSHIRSLNLSNSATAVAYECLRQLNYSS